MFRKLFQRIGLLRTPIFVSTKYDVRVFVMSEGTVQGIPRPLQVLSTTFAWEIDTGNRGYVSARERIEHEVFKIVRYGFTHTLKNGTEEKFSPHAIYKVTYKDITNED